MCELSIRGQPSQNVFSILGETMPDWGWREWTAIVGAVTGTLSFFMNVLSHRLRFVWSSPPHWMDQKNLLLTVDNPSSQAAMVSRVWFLTRGQKPGLFPVRSSDNDGTADDWIETVTTGKIYRFIGPRSSAAIKVNTINNGTLLVLWWHRFWLVPLRIPHFCWVSPTIVEQVNRGAK